MDRPRVWVILLVIMAVQLRPFAFQKIDVSATFYSTTPTTPTSTPPDPTKQWAIASVVSALSSNITGPDCVTYLRPRLQSLGVSGMELTPIILCRCWFRNCPPNATDSIDVEAERCKLQLMQYNSYMTAGHDEFVQFSAVYVVVFVVGLLGNLLVFVVLLRYLPVRNPSNIFITSLTVSDLAMVTLCLPFRLMSYVQLFLLPNWACYLAVFIYRLIFASSVFAMCALGIERYIAICLPLKAKSIATTKHARLIVAIVWIAAAAASGPAYALVRVTKRCSGETYCEMDIASDSNDWFYCYWFVALFCLPLVILSVVYTLICRTLFKSIRKKSALMNTRCARGETKPGGNKDDSDTERKQVIIMIIVLMIVFTICWGPLLIANMLTFASVVLPVANDSNRISNSLYLITFFYPCLDPIIYGIFSNQFRRGYQQFLCHFRNQMTRGRHGHVEDMTHTNVMSTVATTV